MKILNEFSRRFNKNEQVRLETDASIEHLERKFKVFLPEIYKSFLKEIGNVFTPEILNIVVDKEIDLLEVNEFWEIEQIIFDKENEWTSNLSTELIPIANDSLGNLFAFSNEELTKNNIKIGIYFFDHDFNTIEKIANSFENWIEKFNELEG